MDMAGHVQIACADANFSQRDGDGTAEILWLRGTRYGLRLTDEDGQTVAAQTVRATADLPRVGVDAPPVRWRAVPGAGTSGMPEGCWFGMRRGVTLPEIVRECEWLASLR